ncbi:MAG: hypothetical protein EOO67_12685, partial [Microbacterium sp.]
MARNLRSSRRHRSASNPQPKGLLAAFGVLVVSALLLVPLGPSASARLDEENPTADTEIGPNTDIRITSLGAGTNT